MAKEKWGRVLPFALVIEHYDSQLITRDNSIKAKGKTRTHNLV
ncbi:hypothetical protein [Legionella anisa]|nr:hypothetical protein [Legionella anisa]